MYTVLYWYDVERSPIQMRRGDDNNKQQHKKKRSLFAVCFQRGQGPTAAANAFLTL